MRNTLCIIFGLMLGTNLNTRDNVTLYNHFTISPDVWESNGTYWFTLRMRTPDSLNKETVDPTGPMNILSKTNMSYNTALKPCWYDDHASSLSTVKKGNNIGNNMRQIVPQIIKQISYLFHKCVKKCTVLDRNTMDKVDILNKQLLDVNYEILIPFLEERMMIDEDQESESEKYAFIDDGKEPMSINEVLQDLLHDIPKEYRQVTMLGISFVLPLICFILCSGLIQYRNPFDVVADFDVLLNLISDLLIIIEDIRKEQTGVLHLIYQQYQKCFDHMHTLKMDVLLLKDEIYSKSRNTEETFLFKNIEIESRLGVMCKSYVKWKEFDKLKAVIDLTNRTILEEKMMLQKFLIDSLHYLDDCVKTESQTSDVKKKLQYLKMAQSILHTNYHLLVMELSSEHIHRNSGDTALNPISHVCTMTDIHLEAYNCVHSMDQRAPSVTAPSKKIWIGGKWVKQTGSSSVDMYPQELTMKRSYTGSELSDEANFKGELPMDAYATKTRSMPAIHQVKSHNSM